VIRNGSDRGVRKFKCKNSAHEKQRYFTTYTSYNAQELFYNFTIEGLAFLTTEGGSYEGISQYFHTSKYLLEFFLTMLVENRESEEIVSTDNLVVVYSDFSSARLSSKASIVMGKVGDRIHYEVVASENYLTAWEFMIHLKNRLKVPEDAIIVHVTDGEWAWIDPIRKLFSNSIHIRQFHNESAKGIVYIHFPYENKIYTLRVPWDIVLKEGIPPESVKKYRKMRAKRKGEKKGKKVEMDREVILWEGMVITPKGKRKKKDERIEKRSDVEVMKSEEKPERDEEKKKTNPRPAITTLHDHPKKKVIFKGTPEEAKKSDSPILKFIISILITIFGGKYITSNIAESIFGIKSKFLGHRTEKGSLKLIAGILKMNRKWRDKDEVIAYLKKQIPFERFTSCIYRSEKRRKNENKNIEKIIEESIPLKHVLSITYLDRYNRKTYRAIKPFSLYENPLSGLKYVRAKCYLRNEIRTFRLDRISDLACENNVIQISV